MAGDRPRDATFAGGEAYEALQTDSGFGAVHVVLQLLHGKSITGQCFEVPLVQTFVPGRNGAFILRIQPFDFSIGIALKADQFIEMHIVSEYAVLKHKLLADPDGACVQINGNGFIGNVAFGASLACTDEIFIECHEMILSAQTYSPGTDFKGLR